MMEVLESRPLLGPVLGEEVDAMDETQPSAAALTDELENAWAAVEAAELRVLSAAVAFDSAQVWKGDKSRDLSDWLS